MFLLKQELGEDHSRLQDFFLFLVEIPPQFAVYLRYIERIVKFIALFNKEYSSKTIKTYSCKHDSFCGIFPFDISRLEIGRLKLSGVFIGIF